MGILDSIMYKTTSFLFCLLVLWVGQCQAKPGLLDTILGKSVDCDKVNKKISWGRDECAMVFDDDDCDNDGLKIETGSTTFSRLGLFGKTSIDHNASSDYKDDIDEEIECVKCCCGSGCKRG